ncbi:abietadienol/abietadienal oxidase [Coffea eugenioides]|uniref:abietadienol/abietadienal oxidase n=1 Tax=Coffea eugenioides TaxID=49369 RepID=UPI000F5C8394|nr:abietadienol/abietadienal oxidase [Coffea arabica]XP_027169450.1 abietadienol/abietadienal oxidase [Coffea eugenioides]
MKIGAFDHHVWPIICSTLLLMVFLAKFLRKKVKKNVKNRKFQLPPGRRGWPIIGDSIKWYNAVASSHPPQFVEEQVQRYGKIFSCYLFGKRAVVSADPKFNRFVMQNEGKLFQSSYPKSFRDLVGKNGVITAQGEQQKKLHSIASNMMRLEKLKFHFLQDIQRVINQTFNNLHDNQVICLQDICRKVAINLMVNQLLGVSNDSEVNEMAQLFSDFVDGCLSIPINLPGFAYHIAMKARESIISKINKTIETHRQQPSSGVGNGVLQRILEEESLPDDAVADFIINLLFAGNETTAKTMLFAVYFLSQCPMAMRQLLVEQERLKTARNNFGGEMMLTWQDYKAMPFTQCVIDETLRLGGIAIWLMREAKEDIRYQDYDIPKRCFVVPFLSAVHLNETVYEEALNFKPWRWMIPENQEKRNWRNSALFAPFGGGARFCPGAELARLQIALFLHYFITTFRWNQLKEDRMSFFPSARLVNGFQIQLRRIPDDDRK